MVRSISSDFKSVSSVDSTNPSPDVIPQSPKAYDTSSKEAVVKRTLARSKGFVMSLVVFLVCAPLVLTWVLGTSSSKSPWARAKSMVVACESAKPIRTFQRRQDLGYILEEEGMKVGAELGVQRGIFTSEMLSRWPSAERYVLVDLWAQQSNYKDVANHDNDTHDHYKAETLARTKRYADRGTSVEVCQDFTTTCAKRYKADTFDFIYVDARHDYKGVSIDLHTWWPLLKPGGIMAGHDYVTNADGPMQSGQNWSINYDGTVDPSGRAVKGAVDDFFADRNLQLVVAYRENLWNTWAVRKPTLH